MYTISIVALKWNNNRKMLRLCHCRCHLSHAAIVTHSSTLSLSLIHMQFSSNFLQTNKNQWVLWLVHNCTYDFDYSPYRSRNFNIQPCQLQQWHTLTHWYEIKLDEISNSTNRYVAKSVFESCARHSHPYTHYSTPKWCSTTFNWHDIVSFDSIRLSQYWI